jgi:hypothetical protein
VPRSRVAFCSSGEAWRLLPQQLSVDLGCSFHGSKLHSVQSLALAHRSLLFCAHYREFPSWVRPFVLFVVPGCKQGPELSVARDTAPDRISPAYQSAGALALTACRKLTSHANHGQEGAPEDKLRFVLIFLFLECLGWPQTPHLALRVNGPCVFGWETSCVWPAHRT